MLFQIPMRVTSSLAASLENAGNTDLSQLLATCCIISAADGKGTVFTQRLNMDNSYNRYNRDKTTWSLQRFSVTFLWSVMGKILAGTRYIFNFLFSKAC
jgi:hypothetical protein